MHKFFKFFLIFLVICLALPIIYIFSLNLLPRLTLYRPDETVIKYSDGVTEFYHNDRNERYVELNEIGEEKISYLLGLEDQNFYKHHGVDYKRTLKSLLDNITSGEIVSGGSTITQQLARLLYLDNSKTYSRKFKEFKYAKRLENSLTKNQILELYLNEVYFGKNLYGIQSASNYYYSKNAKDLDDNEAISLFAILKAPNSYAPPSDLFKEAYTNAVYSLYERDVIDVAKYYSLINNYPIPNSDNSDIDQDADYKLYAYDSIKREMSNKKLSSNHVGMTIETTIDSSLQQDIGKIIDECKIKTSKEEVAIVVLRPSDGACLSLIGGTDHESDSFNRAIDGITQMGSTIKPILYTTALEKGLTPTTELKSEPTTFHIEGVGDYSPHNATYTYANRNINMVEAISLSDNIYATKVTLLIGSRSITNKLKLVGINNVNNTVTNGLGSLALSPLTITTLYNSLANYGVYHKPYIVKSVSMKGEKVYSQNCGNGLRLFNREKSIIMSYMLLSPYDTALSSYTTPTMLNYVPTKRFSVKTGSTESSSLVMGYNPSYTLGIYVGTDDNSEDYDKTLAKRLFVKIADRLMEKQKDVFYPSENLDGFRLINNTNGLKSEIYYR